MTKQNQINLEEAVSLYEAKIQEQTNIIFALVAKEGGKVVLTADDFASMSDYNTVTAAETSENEITVELKYEDRSND